MAFRCLLSKPYIAGKAANNGLSIWGKSSSSILPTATTTTTLLPLLNNNTYNLHQQQQVRCKITKTKRHQAEKMLEREKRVARGLPAKPKPPKYIPKDTPVINAQTREARDEESKQFDTWAAEEMKQKISKQSETEENLRFNFDGLVMSDRVKRLFELKNGSQSEVVASQKRRGMEVSVIVLVWGCITYCLYCAILI